jgi:hypothetical protein
MATGLGVDPTKDGSGNITSGTSSQDVRQIYGGLYSPGLVSGAKITTSGSAMTYTVATGVGMIQSATGQVVPVPIPSKTINVSTVGSSSRTDYIYVKQNFPATDGDSAVVVDAATTVPDNAIVIGTYLQPANATNTSSGSLADSVDYSIPYGASLGNLYTYRHGVTGLLPNTGITRYGHKTLRLPTDRRLLFKVQATLQAQNATGFDNAHYCEYGFLPNIDGGDFVLWTTPGLHQSLGTYAFEGYFNVTAGTHTVNIGFTQMSGPGRAYTYSGTDSLGFGREGIVFTIEDAGVSE